MESYQLNQFNITLNKEGAKEYVKVSFPVRYGLFSEIETPDYIFQFNLNGEIKYIQGKSQNWPHLGEWLKRTVADDWIYYDSGDYQGFHDLIGEYYFPHLSYPSNSIVDGNPFEENSVKEAIKSWPIIRRRIKEWISSKMPRDLREFLIRVTENDEKVLRLRSKTLHDLIGGPVSVLSPDTRHVDYDVIPIVVADGCLYNCGFCRVKSGGDFKPRTRKNIIEQIKNLKRYYGRDLSNYNSIFLGYHDSLRAGQELIEFAADNVYETFQINHSYLKSSNLFLFGSIDAMIHSEERLFESLNNLPSATYINLGLESPDPETLNRLEKPVPAEMVREAFVRMLEVNRRYEKIEVTANFLLGDDFPLSHLTSLVDLTRNRPDLSRNKGVLYLSPLMEEGRRGQGRKETLRKFRKVKREIGLPAFLYLIQKL